MSTTFFSLPPEVRRDIYAHVFADARTDIIFQYPSKSLGCLTINSPTAEATFLRSSKTCYLDAIESFREARTVRVVNLGAEHCEEFHSMKHIHQTVTDIEFDGLLITDLTRLPSFPKLRRCKLSGMNVWGGYLIIQRGQTVSEAFNDGDALYALLGNQRCPNLMIEDRASKVFPHARVLLEFGLGYQVLDKNLMRGVQDWKWKCLYNVQTDKLEKTVVHKLVLW